MNNYKEKTMDNNTAELLEMLTLTRCHGSEGEELFVRNFIMPLEPHLYRDPNGNILAYVVEVNAGSELTPMKSPILFSSHVDTVHAMTDPVRQSVLYDEESAFAYKDDKRPLGADDAAGVWLMRRMIEARVPGTYIFHRGEERGGIGSRGMLAHYEHFLAGFTHAIAFDRRGQESIITEQMGGPCASDEFALALGNLIYGADNTLDLKPDDTGIFTDTANYTTIIPECTNISIGYENEHSGDEILDVDYLRRLTRAFIEVFSNSPQLPAKRDPSEVYYDTGFNYNYNYNDFKAGKGKDDGAKFNGYEYLTSDMIVGMRFKELVNYVRSAHPEDVADLLVDLAEQVEQMWEKQ